MGRAHREFRRSLSYADRARRRARRTNDLQGVATGDCAAAGSDIEPAERAAAVLQRVFR